MISTPVPRRRPGTTSRLRAMPSRSTTKTRVTPAKETSASTGTTIGYRKLDRFAPVEVRHARVTITKAVGIVSIADFMVRP